MKSRFYLFCLLSLLSFGTFAQKQYRSFSYQPTDSLDKKRCWALGGISAGAFTISTYWLYSAWYSKYDRAKFHFFDDNQEWMQMDKVGHVFSAYFESRWGAGMYRWAGVNPKKSDWIGVAYGMAVQTSLEIADGYSAKWGFSKGDYLANIVGSGIFIGQQLAWKEQRFCVKMSNRPRKYPNTLIYSNDRKYSIPLNQRAQELFGNNYIVSLVKDYNNQTLWLSGNVAAFLPEETRFPKWLNVALGYSLENAYVGDNTYSWTQTEAKNGIPAGTIFNIDRNQYPRHRQFFLSFDIDLTRIKTKSHFLHTLLGSFNVLKIPAPTLEINTLGKIKGHLF